MSGSEDEGPRSELDALLANRTPDPGAGGGSGSGEPRDDGPVHDGADDGLVGDGEPSDDLVGGDLVGGDVTGSEGRSVGAGESPGGGAIRSRLEAWLRGATTDDGAQSSPESPNSYPLTPPSSPDTPPGSPGTERGELRELAIESIRPNQYQPRQTFDHQGLGALADSIREIGVLQPVLVRPEGQGRYELVAGERRWRAARQAGLRTIPALVRETGDQWSLEQAIVENLHREDLNPLEEAAAYQQLADDFGLTQEDVARRVGKSRSAVANTMRLLQLPAKVQRLVREGGLTAGHARALLALDKRDQQRRVAERVVAEELSVRRTEELVRAVIDGREGVGAGGASDDGGASGGRGGDGRLGERSATELEVQRLLQDRLETQVEVRWRGQGGQVVIRFADDEDLSRLVEVLTSRDQPED